MPDLLFSIKNLIDATNGICCNTITMAQTVNGIETDSRKDCSQALFVALRGYVFDGHQFLQKAIDSGATLLCVDREFYTSTPHCKLPLLIVDDTTAAYQDIARFHRRRLDIKVVAITGSSGKTSAKDILTSVLAEAYGDDCVYSTLENTNNHIGVPLNLLNLRSFHKVAIIEMGSNHRGEIEVLSRTAEPDIAIVTSIGSSHLEFFETLENVADEKASVFKYLSKSGTAVIPEFSDYKNILSAAAGSAQKIYFGKDIRGEYLGGNLQGSSFNLSFGDGDTSRVDWSIHGQYQMDNALAVVAAAVVLGVNHSTIIAGLSNSKLSGMRMRINTVDDIHWINDAYNANPDSMIAGLNWLYEFAEPSQLVLVLGDMLELGESSPENHLDVIRTAYRLFPETRIFTVGKAMADTVAKLDEAMIGNIIAFADSQSASVVINSSLQARDVVFLKGSRGIKLEVIEPVN